MISPPPQVTPLEPPSGLHNEHHGTGKNDRIELAPDSTPTAFNNPWPSYRFATLSDAWQSYQKGAAIAMPQLLHTSEKDSETALSDGEDSLLNADGSLKPKARRKSGAGGLFYDPDDDEDSDTPADEREDDDSGDGRSQTLSSLDARRPENVSFPAKVHPLEPVRGYVRPDLKRILSRDNDNDWREPPLVVEVPKWPDGSKTAVTWLGHASALIHIPWKTGQGACGVLFDPIFSYRCSPIQQVGPARYLDTPCQVEDLPTINLCIISHDHYDHLDYNTIVKLWEFHYRTIHFIVPLGVGKWFESCNISPTRITELDWWHEAIVNFPSSAEAEAETAYPPSGQPRIDTEAKLTLKVACAPAQHRSGRGIMDQMATLWASWCVGVVDPSNPSALQPGMKGDWGFKVYFGGDTGYRYASAPDDDESAICPAFKQIGEKYGPVDLALLPLSTGSSLPFLRKLLLLSLDQYTLTSSQHCSPSDSLEIHSAVGAKRSLGIHWGTFCDAAEARATRVEFGRARRAKGVSEDWERPSEKGSFVICDIGDTVEMVP